MATTDYGTVQTEKGTHVTLTQQAYPDGDGSSSWYEALGRDEMGNLYRVRWAIINAESDDQSEACDWEHPYEVKLVERA